MTREEKQTNATSMEVIYHIHYLLSIGVFHKPIFFYINTNAQRSNFQRSTYKHKHEQGNIWYCTCFQAVIMIQNR